MIVSVTNCIIIIFTNTPKNQSSHQELLHKAIKMCDDHTCTTTIYKGVYAFSLFGRWFGHLLEFSKTKIYPDTN